jgi:glycosyl transferase family 87
MTHTDLNAASDPAAGAAAGLPRHGGVDRAPALRRSSLVSAGLTASPVLGPLFLLGALACTVLIELDAAAARSPLVPKSPHIAGYLNGPGSMLDYNTFLIALLVMSACYAGAVLCSRAIPVRVAVGAIVAINLVVFAGPIIFSQDVFQYIGYGRLGVLHGLNPFTHGPAAARHDPIFKFVNRIWYRVPTAYGPLFTLVSYPIALLGVAGAVWGMKVLALGASLAVVALVWLCARHLGRNPLTAIVLVGVNPLWVLYGQAGAHNDLLMDAFMMGGVLLVLRDRDARGAAAVVLGAAVKATSIAVLPFMVLARRRAGLIWGTVGTLAVVALVSFLAFGVHGLDFASVLKRNSTFVSSDSFPNEVAHLLGYPGVFRVDRKLLQIATVLIVLWLLWRTWRGYDWISASAWTQLLLAVTTTWLLAWYLLWALPLAVLARDRRVLWAVMGASALFILHQTAPIFSPTQ